MHACRSGKHQWRSAEDAARCCNGYRLVSVLVPVPWWQRRAPDWRRFGNVRIEQQWQPSTTRKKRT